MQECATQDFILQLLETFVKHAHQTVFLAQLVAHVMFARVDIIKDQVILALLAMIQ
jgi:hypothetical protein